MDKGEVCRYYSSGQPFVHRDGLYNPHLEPLFTSPTTFPHVPVYLVFVHPHELMFLVNLLFYFRLILSFFFFRRIVIKIGRLIILIHS